MNEKAFNALVENAHQRRTALMNRKSAEYMRNDDKLSNFKKAGAMDGSTPEHALMGMAKKHIVSIVDMTNDLECMNCLIKGQPAVKIYSTLDQWQEKLDDLRNYLDLLEALLVERFLADDKGVVQNVPHPIVGFSEKERPEVQHHPV